MNTVQTFVAEKFEKMNDYSFVPHKGVQVYHIDGSFFCFFNAFLEKIRYNDVVYLAVYSKNNGVHVYDSEHVEAYHEFNISVPTSLNSRLKDKAQPATKQSLFTQYWNFVKKILCLN